MDLLTYPLPKHEKPMHLLCAFEFRTRQGSSLPKLPILASLVLPTNTSDWALGICLPTSRIPHEACCTSCIAGATATGVGVDVVNICATPPVVCWAQNRPYRIACRQQSWGDGIEKGRLAEVREVMHTEAESRFLYCRYRPRHALCMTAVKMHAHTLANGPLSSICASLPWFLVDPRWACDPDRQMLFRAMKRQAFLVSTAMLWDGVGVF